MFFIYSAICSALLRPCLRGCGQLGCGYIGDGLFFSFVFSFLMHLRMSICIPYPYVGSFITVHRFRIVSPKPYIPSVSVLSFDLHMYNFLILGLPVSNIGLLSYSLSRRHRPCYCALHPLLPPLRLFPPVLPVLPLSVVHTSGLISIVPFFDLSRA